MGSDETVRLNDRDYTPAEISALILREMKRIAEASLGQPVERAVITVPAYFSDAARQATREAARSPASPSSASSTSRPPPRWLMDSSAWTSSR